jgi:hypothetical protein
MKSKRGWRWVKLAGRAMLASLAPVGGIHFCLPPRSVIQQWPVEGEMWPPERRLGKSERRAWAAIEASLREVEDEL